MSVSDQDKEPNVDTQPTSKLSDWPSPGQKLKVIREERGLSYHRVADALHMTAHYVKSLESDQYDKLPGKTFVKGYFKAYAKLLDADVDEIMQCYEQYVTAMEESQENVADEIRAKKAYDQNLRWVLCAGVIIVLVVSVSWWLSREGNNVTEVSDSGFSNVANIQMNEVTASSTSPLTAEVLIAALEGQDRDEMGRTGQSEDEQLVASYSVTEFNEAITEPGEADEDQFNPVLLSENLSVESGEETGQGIAAVELPSSTSESSEMPVNQRVLPGEQPVTVNDSGETAQEIELPSLQNYSVTRFEDHREVQLASEGEDLLEVHFSGSSWIEVDNGDNIRLYHDMLNLGDDLTIKGKAPFNILIGDASKVDMTFNSRSVNVQSQIRTDNSARILLEPDAN